jgi:hypothetical protein
MATSSNAPKAPKAEDCVNKDMAKALGATVNESALRAWFDKSAELMLDGKLSKRGWSATVEASNSSTVLRESWAPYVVRAYAVGQLKGGDKALTKKLVTTTQDATRAWSAEEFKSALDSAKSFNEFVSMIPARESKSGRGAGATADEKAAEAVKAIAVDADSIITLALGLLTDLEDVTIHNFDNAQRLEGLLKSAIRNSKMIATPAHPAVATA